MIKPLIFVALTLMFGCVSEVEPKYPISRYCPYPDHNSTEWRITYGNGSYLLPCGPYRMYHSFDEVYGFLGYDCKSGCRVQAWVPTNSNVSVNHCNGFFKVYLSEEDQSFIYNGCVS